MPFKIAKIFLTLLLLFCVTTASADDPGNTKTANISLELLDNNHIKLTYTVSTYQQRISLFNPYEDQTNEIRKDWRPLSNCGNISDKGILSFADECLSVSFSVPIKADDVDGGYPPAYPFGDNGVMLHTGVFTISDDCCKSIWTFITSRGAIIIDGINRGTRATVSQEEEQSITFTNVFLSFTRQEKNPSVITNGNVPRWLTNQMLESSKQVTKYYRLKYPKLKFTRPTLFISNRIDESKDAFHADVSSPRMITFAFYNVGEQIDQNVTSIALRMLAHEFAHVLQPNVESPAFVHEGGAEFVRWIAERKLGWISQREFGVQFSQALYECLNFAGERSWKGLAGEDLDQNIASYRCGLIVHAIALASSETKTESEEVVQRYYTRWHQKKDQSFVDGISCVDGEKCESWFSKVSSDDMPFSTHVENQLASLGIIRTMDFSPTGTKPFNLAEKAFVNLLEADCKNYTYQLSSDQSYFEIISSDCRTIKDGLKIVSVNNISYFDDTLKAIDGQNSGCIKDHNVELRTIDNTLFKVECSKKFDPPKNYFEIDAEKLLMILNKDKSRMEPN